MQHFRQNSLILNDQIFFSPCISKSNYSYFLTVSFSIESSLTTTSVSESKILFYYFRFSQRLKHLSRIVARASYKKKNTVLGDLH